MQTKRLQKEGGTILIDIPEQAIQKESVKEIAMDVFDVAPGSVEETQLEPKLEQVHTDSEEDAKEQLEEQKEEERLRKQAVLEVIEDVQSDAKWQVLEQKISMELAKERDRAAKLVGLEQAKRHAIDAARASYGANADVRTIEAYYNGMAAAIDPHVTDVTDMLSMSLDNLLHQKDTVHVLMGNGSVRTMDADVAQALVQCSSTKVAMSKTPDIKVTYSKKIQDLLVELQDTMQLNLHRQMLFQMQPSEPMSVLEKQRPMPNVAYDYAYIFDVDDGANGRMLPSAMYSVTMQQELMQRGQTLNYKNKT